MHYIGRLDKSKLGEFQNRVVTEEVILTAERELHIIENHLNDFYKIISNLKSAILNPYEILVDFKNKDTIMFIKKIK